MFNWDAIRDERTANFKDDILEKLKENNDAVETAVIQLWVGDSHRKDEIPPKFLGSPLKLTKVLDYLDYQYSPGHDYDCHYFEIWGDNSIYWIDYYDGKPSIYSMRRNPPN